MPKVFISYAHSDADKATRLAKTLERNDVGESLDIKDIPAGESISSAVRNALKHSSAFIVLLSPRSLHSEWIQFEVGAAEALEKKIIPVIISGDHLEEELPDILRNRSWIDGRHRTYEAVVADVKRALESTQY